MISGNQARDEWMAKAKRAEIIVFDLDGTLVDSDRANFLAYKDAVMCVLSTQMELDFTRGTRITREILKKHTPSITDKQFEEISSLKERVYHKYLNETKLFTRLIEIISQSKGKEIVLATNSRRCRAEMLLKHHRISEKFTRKIYRDEEYQRDKYARLMTEIQRKTKSILVFENDDDDIDSAIACGIEIDQIIDVRGK